MLVIGNIDDRFPVNGLTHRKIYESPRWGVLSLNCLYTYIASKPPLTEGQARQLSSMIQKAPNMPNPKLANHAQKIHQLETSLTPPIHLKGITDSKFSLTERMAHYKVPGVSVALIENGEIAWAKTWGLANADTQAHLNANTLF